MSIPILNASSMLLNQNSGTLPQMSTALLDWFQLMTFIRVSKTLDAFSVKETYTDVDFMGVWQPFKPRDLEMRAEGQRQWDWYMVHALPTLVLIADEIVIYQNARYRVMGQIDYKIYGFIEYHLIRDYTQGDFLVTEDGDQIVTEDGDPLLG